MPTSADEARSPNALLEMLLASIEAAGEAVVLTDLEGTILYVNPAFERITQYSRQEALGKNPRILKCEQNDPALYRVLWQTISDGQVWRGSFLNRKKDGTIYHVEQTIAPVLDDAGRPVSYVSVHRDVTDSHRTQEALRLAAAVESAGDTVMLADLEGTVLYVNAAYERLCGVPRNEVLGKRMRECCCGGETLISSPRRELWESLVSGESWCGAFRGQRADGRAYYLEKTVSPVRNAADETIGYVWVGRDVTQRHARREAERSLAAANRQMDLAKSIQQRLFPQAAPTLAGFDLAGRTFPADHVCGDYFDFLPMQGGSWGVAVGDISGHGLGAALLMIDTRAYLRALATTFADPGEILSRVNALLSADIETVGFATLFLARLDTVRGTVLHAAAGHEGWLLRRDGSTVTLPSTGLPLGIVAQEKIPCAAEVAIAPGDVILLATDGLTEARSPADELFGAARALDVVRQHRDRSAEEIVQALYAAAQEFSAGQPLQDDITIVILKRHP